MHECIYKLDRGSIRSSPRYSLSTPYRLTIRNSARLVHHVLLNLGDLNLVLPVLNLSTLNFDNDATSKIDDVFTKKWGLLNVLHLAVHLRVFCRTNRKHILHRCILKLLTMFFFRFHTKKLKTLGYVFGHVTHATLGQFSKAIVKPWPQTLSLKTQKPKTKGPWADTKML